MIGIRTPGIETRLASSFTKKASQADDEIDTSYDDTDVVGGDEPVDPSWDDDVDLTRDHDGDAMPDDEDAPSDGAPARDEDRVRTKVRRDDGEELT